MLKKVQNHIEREQLLQRGDTLILGVSGGPDSMALLYIMKQLAPRWDVKLAAAHLNHKLRPEAEEEETFIEGYCRQASIPLYIEREDVKIRARLEKRNIEDMGRHLRYAFFSRLKQQLQAQVIATAHHYDDQAETVLLHLIRGSGIKGLRGILPHSGHLIRPLLPVSKNEILEFLHQHGVPYRLDPSNEDPAYLRNRIRHHLIPLLLRDYNPAMVEKLGSLAEIAREEDAVLEEESAKKWEICLLKMDKTEIVLDYRPMRELKVGWQRRILLRALASLAGKGAWELRDIEAIRRLAAGQGSSKAIHLKKNVKVIKSYDKLIFTYNLPSRKGFSYPVEKIPGTVIIAETGEEFILDLLTAEAGRKEPATAWLLDYDKIKGPLCLRSRRPGDRFHPPGLQGSKKVKDLFIDKKIPYYQREQIALLAGEQIYAIPGIAISRVAAPDQASSRLLRIKKRPWAPPGIPG